jgi:hypothetical protein
VRAVQLRERFEAEPVEVVAPNEIAIVERQLCERRLEALLERRELSDTTDLDEVLALIASKLEASLSREA